MSEAVESALSNVESSADFWNKMKAESKGGHAVGKDAFREATIGYQMLP